MPSPSSNRRKGHPSRNHFLQQYSNRYPEKIPSAGSITSPQGNTLTLSFYHLQPHHTVGNTVMPGIAVQCSECQGRGKIHGNTCLVCDSHGYVFEYLDDDEIERDYVTCRCTHCKAGRGGRCAKKDCLSVMGQAELSNSMGKFIFRIFG